ncbi:MAG: DUF542 domain-containing protein [Gemmatimonadetes bacterium]|nr:DUF542 domain-containing protein [Gemmatimonadota bacterium]
MTTTQDTTIVLDVRPVLARGDEPFQMIMEAAARVPVGGTLELTAPFHPVPLYGLLATRGFAHQTEPLDSGAVVVRFVQTGILPGETVAAVHQRYPATAPVFAQHGMDLCCGGTKTLEFAAKAHGVDLPRLLAQLQQAAAGTAG